MAFPDVVRIWRRATPGYLEYQRKRGWGDGTAASGVRAALFCHGHEGAWSAELMTCLLESLGYAVSEHALRESPHEHLRNLENHGFGEPEAWASTCVQTTCLEAQAPDPGRINPEIADHGFYSSRE